MTQPINIPPVTTVNVPTPDLTALAPPTVAETPDTSAALVALALDQTRADESAVQRLSKESNELHETIAKIRKELEETRDRSDKRAAEDREYAARELAQEKELKERRGLA